MSKQAVMLISFSCIVSAPAEVPSTLAAIVTPPLRKHSAEFRTLVKECAPQAFQEKLALLLKENCPEENKPNKMLFYGNSGVGKTTAFEVLVQETGMPGILINAGQLGEETQNSVAKNLRKHCQNLQPNSWIGIDNFQAIVHASMNTGSEVAIQVWETIDGLVQAGHRVVGIMNTVGTLDNSLQTRFAGKTIEFPYLSQHEKIIRAIKYHLGKTHECSEGFIAQLASECRSFSVREIRDLIIDAKGAAQLRSSAVVQQQDCLKELEKLKKSRELLANEKKESWGSWTWKWLDRADRGNSVIKWTAAATTAIAGYLAKALPQPQQSGIELMRSLPGLSARQIHLLTASVEAVIRTLACEANGTYGGPFLFPMPR